MPITETTYADVYPALTLRDIAGDEAVIRVGYSRENLVLDSHSGSVLLTTADAKELAARLTRWADGGGLHDAKPVSEVTSIKTDTSFNDNTITTRVGLVDLTWGPHSVITVNRVSDGRQLDRIVSTGAPAHYYRWVEAYRSSKRQTEARDAK